MVLKIDYLWKHVGCCKTLVFMLNVKARGTLFLKNQCICYKWKLYFVKGPKTMLQQVVKGVKLVNMKK